ncbi:MAG: hypothetical protein QOG63_208 [Thermoleophilaceae bacterium]|nr:hypothetical protein [Thermoleophilaceae bacterium]
MLTRFRHRLTYANVMATIAVFIALGGSSYAALTLKRGSVKGKHIARNAITSPKVKDASLLSQDFAPGQLPRGERGEVGPKGDPGADGQPGPPNPNAQNSDLLDNLDSTAFLPVGGKAADANLLDNLDSTAFLAANGKAADANLLDNLDSTAFLRTTGKAADADKVDGVDSTHLTRSNNGNLYTFSAATSPGSNSYGGATAHFSSWYSCPNPTSANGIVNFRNESTTDTINLFVDNGGANPTYITLGPGATHGEPASPSGEAIDFDAQGYGSGAIVHVRTLSVNRASDCHFQLTAAEAIGGN